MVSSESDADYLEAVELGDGYTVEAANQKNAGGTYDTAVVVTNNNESAANGNTSELGQPTTDGAALANVGAKIRNNSEQAKRLGEIVREIDSNGALGAHQMLHQIAVALDRSAEPKRPSGRNWRKNCTEKFWRMNLMT